MPYFDVANRARKAIQDDIDICTFWGEEMLLSRAELGPNAILARHSHPHEQCGVILSGALTLTLDGETRLLQPGDMYLVPGDVEHGGTAGPEGCVALDVFAPVREEYQY
jgi:quercetin dioxygenase-like cupin family protein